MNRIEVQEALRRLQHAEDMAARSPEGEQREALRAEIRRGWQTIKPFVVGKRICALA